MSYSNTPLDLRGMPAGDQQTRFVKAFMRLDADGSMRVLLDADPAALLYPLRLIYADELECRLDAAGPESWTVVVRRRHVEGSLGPIKT